jgi:chemotaxis protein MotB
MTRKKAKKDGVGQGWLMTFSDMVTLLLCFFVLLFQMSTLDIDKFRALVANLQGSPYIWEELQRAAEIGATGLERAPDVPESDMIDPSDEWMIAAAEMQSVIDDILQGMGAEDLSITLDVSEGQIIISIQGRVLFRVLDDALLPSGIEALELIMGAVMPHWETHLISEIHVEGHADIRQVPPGNRFGDNDILAAYRARAVMTYIINNFEIPQDRIGMVSWGATRPVGGDFGESEEQWERNRRVELVLYRNFLINEESGQAYQRDV